MRQAILLLLLLPTGEAMAYKPAPPRRHDVHSADREFVLDVNPDAKRFTVFVTGKRDQPLWSFERRVGLGEHFLSSDGKVVAIVSWRFVQADSLADGVCVEFWNQAGKFHELTFAELCPHPARYLLGPGPVGLFWRNWYTVAERNGNTLRLTTTDEFEYDISLSDGQVLQARRIGLPWWLYWLVFVLLVSLVPAFVYVRLQRRRASAGTVDGLQPDQSRIQ